MSRAKLLQILGGWSVALLSAGMPAAETFDDAMQKSLLDYSTRQREANAELITARTKVAEEKAPFLRAMRAAENRIVTAQSEISRRETEQEQVQDNRQRLVRDAETLQRNRAYVNSLAQDGLKGFEDGALPAEDTLVAEPLRALHKQLDEASDGGEAGRAAGNVTEFLLTQVERSLGGYAVPGRAMLEGDSRIVDGNFAFAGPQVFFRANEGLAGLAMRRREGEPGPVVYRLPAWPAADVTALFRGKPGMIPADATAGKALRLQETRGTLVEHINKGGAVAYAIVGVGLLALLLILLKIRDVFRMRVDEPEAVLPFLVALAGGETGEAEKRLGGFKASTRELFATGMAHRHEPKAVLEEHLQALLMRQRLQLERRLPLLAVIATAAPLMGLLGTVVGMVRTFALITVFGTGNAGKLAGGISEVLVATELGLVVAIPALVAHGFLATRVQKNLAMLERYALEFITAAKATEPVGADEQAEPVSP
jgi:biopolymer transport protein ExbB